MTFAAMLADVQHNYPGSPLALGMAGIPWDGDPMIAAPHGWVPQIASTATNGHRTQTFYKPGCKYIVQIDQAAPGAPMHASLNVIRKCKYDGRVGMHHYNRRPAHVSLAMVEDQIERKVATFKPGRKETGLISNLTMLNALRRWHQYKSEVQA